MPNKLIPFGYGVPGAVQRLADMMEQNQHLWLIDIRYSPRSRIPAWQKWQLKQTYRHRYVHLGLMLGNINYNKPGEPIVLAHPQGGIPILLEWLRLKDVAILCGCATYETCHRKVVVGLVKEQRPEVEVIL